MDVSVCLMVVTADGEERELELDAVVRWGCLGAFNPYDGGTGPEADEVEIRRAAWTDTSAELAVDALLVRLAGEDAAAQEAALEHLCERILERAQDRWTDDA